MVNLCKNRVRLGSQKIRVRLVAGTTLRGYDLTSILFPSTDGSLVSPDPDRFLHTSFGGIILCFQDFSML